MNDKPTDVRAPSRAGAAFGGGEPIARADATLPIPRAALRMRKIAVTVFALLTIAGGAGLSAIPFNPREVTRTQRLATQPITQPAGPMRMEQTGRGVPFQVYVMERGPIEAAIRTNAIINVNASGVALNMLVVALAQIVLLGLGGALRRKG